MVQLSEDKSSHPSAATTSTPYSITWRFPPTDKEEKSRVREWAHSYIIRSAQTTHSRGEHAHATDGGPPQSADPSSGPASSSASGADDRISPSAPSRSSPIAHQHIDNQLDPEAHISQAESETSTLSPTMTITPPYMYHRGYNSSTRGRPASPSKKRRIDPSRKIHDKASSKRTWARSRQHTTAPLALQILTEYCYVVLLQEPWAETKEGRCLTKSHPGYGTFSPIDSLTNNSTRPRVMTDVRQRPA